MPQLDNDIITLAHGSGGKLTNRLLDEAIFKVLDNPMLETRGDGALFEGEGKSTKSFGFMSDSFS